MEMAGFKLIRNHPSHIHWVSVWPTGTISAKQKQFFFWNITFFIIRPQRPGFHSFSPKRTFTAGRNGHQALAPCSYRATGEGLLFLACLGKNETGFLGQSKVSLSSRQPRVVPLVWPYSYRPPLPDAHRMVLGAAVQEQQASCWPSQN